MTDYFVICSGASDRQLGAIADGIVEGLHDEGTRPLSREGDAGSHWVLLDFGGVIVHVMSVPEREFYQLEKLWVEGLAAAPRRVARRASSRPATTSAPRGLRVVVPPGHGDRPPRHRSIQPWIDRIDRSDDEDGRER